MGSYLSRLLRKRHKPQHAEAPPSEQWEGAVAPPSTHGPPDEHPSTLFGSEDYRYSSVLIDSKDSFEGELEARPDRAERASISKSQGKITHGKDDPFNVSTREEVQQDEQPLTSGDHDGDVASSTVLRQVPGESSRDESKGSSEDDGDLLEFDVPSSIPAECYHDYDEEPLSLPATQRRSRFRRRIQRERAKDRTERVKIFMGGVNSGAKPQSVAIKK